MVTGPGENRDPQRHMLTEEGLDEILHEADQDLQEHLLETVDTSTHLAALLTTIRAEGLPAPIRTDLEAGPTPTESAPAESVGLAMLAVPGHKPGTGSVGGLVLPASHESLARGMFSSAPGTIFALALSGGLTLGPGDGRQILFGRDRHSVHVCLGEDDVSVDRLQGTLTHIGGRWQVRNTGQLPIRIGERLLFPGEEPVPLGTGYTVMFVQTPLRQHPLEVFVTGPGQERPVPRHAEATAPPEQWPLNEMERLVLVVLSQRYLQHQPRPQPLSYSQAAELLSKLRPAEGWTAKRAAHVVARVRARLSDSGVLGLTHEEVGNPVGNALNHNLIHELLISTTLVPMDLALINAA